MRRRKFITLIGGAVAGAWSLTARAQQGEPVRRIGILANGPETDAEVVARVAAFRKALQNFGWIDGTNLKVDARFVVSEGDLVRRQRS